MPSLPGPLCPEVVAPERALFRSQIEVFDIKLSVNKGHILE